MDGAQGTQRVQGASLVCLLTHPHFSLPGQLITTRAAEQTGKQGRFI